MVAIARVSTDRYEYANLFHIKYFWPCAYISVPTWL